MNALRVQWQQRWQSLSRRDQQALTLAAAVLGALLLWTLAVAPAWRTWRDVPVQRELLEVQRLQMQRLADEARELKQQTAVTAEQSQQALQAATERLGAAGKLSVSGARATLTLNGATPDQFTAWLSEARNGARARAIELNLQRSDAGLRGQVVVVWNESER